VISIDVAGQDDDLSELSARLGTNGACVGSFEPALWLRVRWLLGAPYRHEPCEVAQSPSPTHAFGRKSRDQVPTSGFYLFHGMRDSDPRTRGSDP
jgi:hypothetical protein